MTAATGCVQAQGTDTDATVVAAELRQQQGTMDTVGSLKPQRPTLSMALFRHHFKKTDLKTVTDNLAFAFFHLPIVTMSESIGPVFVSHRHDFPSLKQTNVQIQG